MGSRLVKQFGIIFTIVILAATASRTAAQETPQTPPPAPGGVLGTPPQEVPDSTPVIEHPPENEPPAPPQHHSTQIGNSASHASPEKLVQDDAATAGDPLPTHPQEQPRQQTAVHALIFGLYGLLLE